MGIDTDSMLAYLHVPDPIFPEPYVTGPVFLNGSGIMYSENGNILLNGSLMNCCGSNRAELSLNGSCMNVSCTSFLINGSIVNSKVTADIPSIFFNGSSVNVSSSVMNLNSTVKFNNDTPIISQVPPTNVAWQSNTGQLYIYNNNGVKYLCVV